MHRDLKRRKALVSALFTNYEIFLSRRGHIDTIGSQIICVRFHCLNGVLNIIGFGSQPSQFPCFVPKRIISNIYHHKRNTSWQFGFVFLPVIDQLFILLSLECSVSCVSSSLKQKSAHGFVLTNKVLIRASRHDEKHGQWNIRMLRIELWELGIVHGVSVIFVFLMHLNY